MSYNYIFQKKLLHMKTKGSVYNTHLFSKNSPRNSKVSMHIKLCFVVLKAWVEKQYKLSNLVLLSAGLGQRRSTNKQNGGLGYLVFGCPLPSFVLRKLGLFEFIFFNN